MTHMALEQASMDAIVACHVLPHPHLSHRLLSSGQLDRRVFWRELGAEVAGHFVESLFMDLYQEIRGAQPTPYPNMGIN